MSRATLRKFHGDSEKIRAASGRQMTRRHLTISTPFMPSWACPANEQTNGYRPGVVGALNVAVSVSPGPSSFVEARISAFLSAGTYSVADEAAAAARKASRSTLGFNRIQL